MKLVENKTYGCETVTSGDLPKFAKTHGFTNPIRVPVRIKGLTGSGAVNECHTNSLTLAYRYGGSVVTGFVLPSGLTPNNWRHQVLFGHSVWITPEGNAVCPTLHHDTVASSEGFFEFVPCVEHDEVAIRDFFENDGELLLIQDVHYSASDASYILAGGLDAIKHFQRMGLLNRLSNNDWKRFIKNQTKTGYAGTKDSPLRRRLLTHTSWYARPQTLGGVIGAGRDDFMRKVLPNLKSSAALSY